MRFEVNGQMFFVNFVPEEGRWFCYAPTATGLQKIPVSMDASPFEAYTVDVDEQARKWLIKQLVLSSRFSVLRLCSK